MQRHLTGLIAAPYTAMNEDFSINLDIIEKQAESLITNGVSGAFICGTTGEGLSLTVEERMRIAEKWVSVARGKLNIIVHVGHTCLFDSMALAEHAKKIGADAIASVGPCYFKPNTVEALISFCAEIAKSAIDLPFYYYHIPSFSGVDLMMIDFLRNENIPNFAGIKFSHENLMDFCQCLNLDNGRYDMLFGRDEILLSALVLGAKGAVGSTYNFAAPLYHLVMTACQAGDMETAQIEQSRAVNMVNTLIKHGGIVAGKATMKMIGIDCGPVRLPLQNLSEKQYENLYEELKQIGFFGYCSLT